MLLQALAVIVAVCQPRPFSATAVDSPLGVLNGPTALVRGASTLSGTHVRYWPRAGALQTRELVKFAR